MGIMPAAINPGGSPVAWPIYIVDQNGKTGGGIVGSMPAALPPAGAPVAMPVYVVDQNGAVAGVSPLIIADEAIAIAGLATTVYNTNAVYLYAFELYTTTIFTGGKWRCGATTTGTSDIGIYTFAGVLLADTGAVTNVASTNMSANFAPGQVSLPPGQYFAAFSVSNSTDTIVGVTLGNPAIMTRCRQATNTATPPLPANTGGYSNVPAKFPAFSLTVLNGLI
jgi:hypothetical protein